MINKILPKEPFDEPRSNHQQLFVYYTVAVLVDLTVLNLFNEFWEYVLIESFIISLFAAILLQALLRMTLVLEHRVSQKFTSQPGLKPKIYRFLSAWGIVFTSKIIILEAINLAFGDAVLFTGPIDGLVVFIVVVVAILLVEHLFKRIYDSMSL